MKRRALLLPVLVLVVVGLAACGDDDDTDAAGAELILGVNEGDGTYAFTGAPETFEGGSVKITLDNSDGTEAHEVQLLKVDEGTTYEDFAAFSEEEGAPLPDFFGEVAGGIGPVAPGASASTVQDLPEGRYLYFCELEAAGDDSGEGPEAEDAEEAAQPEGEGEEAGEEEEIPTHAQLGMEGTLSVEGDGSEAEAPETSGSITVQEYEFETDGLTAGPQTIALANAGNEYHHVIAAALAEGKTLDDVKAFFESEGPPEGPPPVDFEQSVGTAVLAPGQEVVTDLQLESGSYAMFCFITDQAGGPPHFTKGMLSELQVE